MYFQKTILTVTIPALSVCLLWVLLSNCNKHDNSAADDNKIQLGHYLFYDRRLSVNNTRSCGTCHNPAFAFTDGYKRSLGVYADLHQRNTQPVFNLSYLKYLTSADSSIHNAEQQMNNPLFNQHPQEMGVAGNERMILEKLRKDKSYTTLFGKAFPGQKDAITIANVISAISHFMYTIQSADSPYDRFINGDSMALSADARKGMQLFFSDKLKCASCHGGFNFSAPSVTNQRNDTLYYFNTGLYNLDDSGSYPAYDQGLYQFTHQQADKGAFRVPTLRNLAFTAPYFHDGSAATLEEVIAVYENGGRLSTRGIYSGDGRKNIYKHPLIKGFPLNSQQRKELISFLYSLSDTAVLTNPAYSNPFTDDETIQ